MSLPSIQFYFDIAFHNGVEQLLNGFLGNKELLSEGYEYLREYDYYMKDEMVIDSSTPVFEMSIIDRETYLKGKLSSNKQLLYKEIRTVLEAESNDNKTTSLKKVFDELDIIFKKNQKADYKHSELVQDEFSLIIQELKSQYHNLLNYHKLYSRINDFSDNGSSFFELKDKVKIAFLSDLYDGCINLDLIDDVEIPEEIFVDVFSSVKPNPEEGIKFREQNYTIAYFLDSIKPFFNNLTDTTIEQSSCFYNKQGKALNSNDLYRVKSAKKGLETALTKKIDSLVEDLKKTHLK